MNRWLDKRSTRQIALTLLVLAAVAIAIRRWAWMPVLIIGESMSPSLHASQLVGCNKLVYRFRPPQRGDIVAVWTGKELMIKRVLGLPGEQIELRAGIFFVNGSPLQESYPHILEDNNIAPGRLRANTFALAGDNRPRSVITIANRDRIVGRLFAYSPSSSNVLYTVDP